MMLPSVFFSEAVLARGLLYLTLDNSLLNTRYAYCIGLSTRAVSRHDSTHQLVLNRTIAKISCFPEVPTTDLLGFHTCRKDC